MKTATEAFREVSAAAKIEITELQETRFIDSMEIGEWVRQGDIYLEKIESKPFGCLSKTQMQLAPGKSQGSRHILQSGNVYAHPKEGQIEMREALHYCYGPVIESKEHLLVTHPEHAHISLPPGCYQVSYQVDTQQMKRVAD